MTTHRRRQWIAAGVVLAGLARPSSAADVTVALPEDARDDQALSLAAKAVVAALEQAGDAGKVVYQPRTKPIAISDVIAVGAFPGLPKTSWSAETPEAYAIKPLPLSGRRGSIVLGDERGRAYALHKLAERVRLGESPWQVDLDARPAFPIRIFSEEGQLLDIPDRGYYLDRPPYVNEPLLCEEMAELKRLLPHIASLGYNALAVLHLGVEEYIDYRHLDEAVYPPDDPHRRRSPIFCKVLTELCDAAHALHLEIYLQVYEIQYPQRLHELYHVDLDSPYIERIIRARYRELFERVPLDGMIITATETHPRVAYRSKALWRKKGRAGAGRMITMYHNACEAMGKRCMVRLWRVASDAKGMREVLDHCPDDAMLSIKNTGGDFWLSWPLTSAITDGLAKTQPVTVVFDTFRQYDGWSRLFVYMKRWGPIVRTCREQGVVGINAWGPWAEGCIWPDHEPGYLTGADDARISWRGHWASFRMLTRGFTPGQANVYLLSRLAWAPDADVVAIARDFAGLHLGPANADAAAEALLATEDAFAEEYLGRQSAVTHPCYIKWTMVFSPRAEPLEKAYKAGKPEDVYSSNARGLAAVDRMVRAFARADRAKAPQKQVYDRFAEGIAKTALYLRTFYLWRECWWRQRADRDLTGRTKADNAEALRTALGKLLPLFDAWERYAEEAGFWRVTFRYGRPTISPAYPYWYPHDDTTMESSARAMAGAAGMTPPVAP